MAVQIEHIKSGALLLIGAVMGVRLYVAVVAPASDTSASHPGFLAADDPPLGSSFFGGGMYQTSPRRLDGVDDVPFAQNATHTMCANWVHGDRLFAKFGMDLPQCFAECDKREQCNYFSIAMTGNDAGKCLGCRNGLTAYKQHFGFFTMQRRDKTTSFSCLDGLVTSVDLLTLVDNDRLARLCITKSGDEKPKCFDLLNKGLAKASVTLCTASSSTSTSTMTSSTSSSSLTSTSQSTTSTSQSTTTSASQSTTTSTSQSTTSTSQSTTTSTSQSTISTSSSTSTSQLTRSSSTSTSTDYTFVPKDKPELKDAVDMWLESKSAAREKYGDISRWSTSLIKDMDYLFDVGYQEVYFDDSIANWDVSQVTTMRFMFRGIRFLKQDLSAWDVSNVVDMHGMFCLASNFDLELSAWDVSKVVDMGDMFAEASNFHVDLSGWNTTNLVYTGHMFDGAVDFHLEDITGWDVSKVHDMTYMFAYTPFNQDISSWDVGSVTTMHGMFFRDAAFNQDISKWDVSNVEFMTGMFYFATNFNQDLLSWDVSNVKSMHHMFWRAFAFNGNISTWNVARVTDMRYMFYDAKVFSQDISAWDVSSVHSMDGMFSGAHDFLDVDVSVWKPSSLSSSPSRFISSASIACTQGNWGHWPYVPDCY